MKAVLLAAAIVIMAIPADVDGRVWTVGRGSTDFPLIAPAIAVAADGDEIRIGPGVYREDLVLAKRLSLVGEGGPVLFGTGRGTVIDVRADNCEIRNLIIDGTGVGAGNQMDAAVRLTSSGNVVSGNVMRRVFYGVVIAGGSSNVVDRQHHRRACSTFRSAVAATAFTCTRDPATTIIRNRVVGQRDAIFLQYAHEVRVEHNVVEQSRYGLHDMFSDDTIVRDNVFRSLARRRQRDELETADDRAKRVLAQPRHHGHRPDVEGLRRFACRTEPLHRQRARAAARRIVGQSIREQPFRAERRGRAAARQRRAEHVSPPTNFFRTGATSSRAAATARTPGAPTASGNRWSRYSGFDFDGDGVGESAHSLLRPFDRIEASNDLARLYLQSPAAGALDLAARAMPDAQGLRATTIR